MTEPKRVAVVGGTGNLGGSVALSLHRNSAFNVRVLSRNAEAPKANRLAQLGIEVVTANGWDVSALDKALAGCWALFINIDSDNPKIPLTDIELEQEEQWKSGKQPSEFDMGKNIIDCAVRAGVRHLVHASLPAASKLTDGRVPMISFDDKSRISEYMMAAVETHAIETGTVVNAGWFLENAFDPKYIVSFGGFAGAVDPDGYLTWKTPPMGNKPESVPWLAVADDYGDLVHGVLLDPARWNGQYIDGVSESMGFGDLTWTFQNVTGKKSRYLPVDNGVLTAGEATKTKEVNGLFDLMHALHGCFFNGRPTEHEKARLLKQAALAATGRQGGLMTVEQFFRKYA
ncbi:hypothetical protein ASPZODRAFT_170187 [Penicilliopsis zonata CBS 506.65]|uniref:NmrA-like domain-containing protein n=1 Tax=Penicilliopsis zonata CBS 506.65 TaxID=1073090 RepID=A0A1L9S5F2_9EURO|nr:hypothetical protein ASPZODRAFT_170187 [Penicilliopsis zonata CBS 506.65]OJJ42396.1 hypothetical protein ASPZODRAFT_170187 [Penicilliopsis zonata CBS 506.65]